MPLIDMPLEQLKEYRGTNPRPDDFNKYWDKALDEMRSVNPEVELVPNRFQTSFADCFDIFFTGVRNARIHAKYIRPKNTAEPHPAVLFFHGYQGSSCDWSDLLNYTGMGFSIAYLDCRGQGGLSEDSGGVKGNTVKGHIIRGLDDKPENLLFRHIFLDTAELANIIMAFPEVDQNRVGTAGGSQGGGLALACAALEPGIKKAAAHFPFLCDYKRIWDMDLAKDAYEELKSYFRKFDPLHEKENEIFTRLGYIDVQNFAERIKGEVLFCTGLMDTWCPPSAQFSVYNKIKSEKRMLIYPDFGHEAPYPGYNDRVFEFLSEL